MAQIDTDFRGLEAAVATRDEGAMPCEWPGGRVAETGLVRCGEGHRLFTKLAVCQSPFHQPSRHSEVLPGSNADGGGEGADSPDCRQRTNAPAFAGIASSPWSHVRTPLSPPAEIC